MRATAEARAEGARAVEQCGALETARQELAARGDRLRRQAEAAVTAAADARAEAARLRAEPLRQLAAATASVAAVTAGVTQQADAARAALAAHEGALAAHDRTLSDVAAARRELDVRAAAQRAAAAAAGDAVDAAELGLARERDAHKRLLEGRLEARAAREAASAAARSAEARRDAAAAAYARGVRELQRREGAANDAIFRLPALAAAVGELDAERASLERQAAGRLAGEVAAVRAESSALAARAAREDVLDRATRAALAAATEETAALEAQRDAWAAEEAAAVRHAGALRAARDAKLREGERMAAGRAATLDACRARELALVDVSQALAGVGASLAALTRAYEAVTGEKAAYATAVAAAAQAGGEMRERTKILANEVEILSNEAAAKGRALAKEQAAHALSHSQRDVLRGDANRVAAAYRQRQAAVEGHIQAIDKLNSVIAGLERDMLALRRAYEGGVEGRNYAGIALIDRNDELVILYDKANVHAAALAGGEARLAGVQQELRALGVAEGDLERQLALARRAAPQAPALAARVLGLQRQLEDARGDTAALCGALEAPGGGGGSDAGGDDAQPPRWRPLGGADPDAATLAARVAALERRVDAARDQAVDRDVRAQQLAERVDAARAQLAQVHADAAAATVRGGIADGDGDGATPAGAALARHASALGARVSEADKRLAALVAELAMYRASLAELASEVDAAHDGLAGAQAAFLRGQPPTPAAELQWRSLQRRGGGRRRPSAAAAAAAPAGTGSTRGVLDAPLLTTTAVAVGAGGPAARPNAYLPAGADDLPLPKPYGGFAPFLPSETPGARRYFGGGGSAATVLAASHTGDTVT